MRSVLVESGRSMPWERATATASSNMVRKRSSMPSGGEDGAEGELAGGRNGSQDGEQDELVPEDVVDVVADLGLDAGGAEGLGDGLDTVWRFAPAGSPMAARTMAS